LEYIAVCYKDSLQVHKVLGPVP
jgi:hypothetical protein